MISAYEGREPYIFISYAHKDSVKVNRTIEALQNAGYRVWFDAGIEAGSEWPEKYCFPFEKKHLCSQFYLPTFHLFSQLPPRIEFCSKIQQAYAEYLS